MIAKLTKLALRKKRLSFLKQKGSPLVASTRYWNKASPKKKALIVAASVGPKVALVGGAYFLARKDEEV